MKALWLLLAIAVPLQSINAQVQHAPTVEQCRANQKLWLSKLVEPGTTGLAKVTFDELDGWFLAMDECQKVDPELTWRYYNTKGEATNEQLFRLMHFLDRHNLRDQFIAEDKQGKR
jgi:hypothetical protein